VIERGVYVWWESLFSSSSSSSSSSFSPKFPGETIFGRGMMVVLFNFLQKLAGSRFDI
jgi:hypothetical protein